MNARYTLLVSLVVLYGNQFSSALAAPVDAAHLDAEYDKLLTEQFSANEPGATALVARNGEILYQKAFGMANLELQVPMHIDHVFRIGSITKQFTAVAILQLMEQGRLSVHDEITKFIPNYPTRGSNITIEHLLTHTSGIQDYAKIKGTTRRGTVDFSPAEMIDYFDDRPMRFASGEKWEYSNSNYFLLGYVIEVVSGETYGDYLEEHIFKPLGMSYSYYASDIKVIENRADGYSRNELGIENSQYLSMTQPYAAGAILSTVGDLFKWHQAIRSYKVIDKESLASAMTRYTLSTGEQTRYGYGWRFGYIQDSPSIWHGGLINGFIAMELYLPEEGVFVAVFSNCDCNSPEDITAKLAALAISEPYEYKSIDLPDAVLAGYTGLYEDEKGLQRVITASEHQLFAQSGRAPRSKVNAYAEDKFFMESDTMSSIEFARSETGGIASLITKSRTSIEVWKKTDKPIPSQDGIDLDVTILKSYVGEYAIAPDFGFTVTLDQKRLFVQATGQEAFEIFAENETKFFLKINDAQLEFVNDNSGSVTKVVLTQGGRTTEAKKIR